MEKRFSFAAAGVKAVNSTNLPMPVRGVTADWNGFAEWKALGSLKNFDGLASKSL